jgi:NAD(P)H-hydrate epimerase
MKLLNAEQTRWLDNYTIQHEPVSSINLMERAATKFYDEFIQSSKPANEQQVFLFCGTGNNGGDGFVVARKLAEAGIQVSCFLLGESDQLSKDCAINKARFEKIQSIHLISSEKDFPSIKQNDTVIDDITCIIIFMEID